MPATPPHRDRHAADQSDQRFAPHPDVVFWRSFSFPSLCLGPRGVKRGEFRLHLGETHDFGVSIAISRKAR